MRSQKSITAEDEKAINYWLKVYKKEIILCICALVPVLPLTLIPWLGDLRIAALAIIIIILGAIITGCAWKLAKALKYYLKLKTVLNVGFIETITGRLQNLKVTNYNLLQYQIENETITLTAQESAAWSLRIVGTQSLQNIPIRLHILSLSATKNILLSALYQNTQHINSNLEPFTADENEKQRWNTKVMWGVWIGICFLALIFAFISFPYEEWGMLLIIWSIFFSIMSTVVFLVSNTNSRGSHKVVTSGTVSEIIVIRHRNGQRMPYYNRFWYRLGSQMVLGRDIPIENNKWKDDIAPGDTVSFEHHTAKKGQRGTFISVNKID